MSTGESGIKTSIGLNLKMMPSQSSRAMFAKLVELARKLRLFPPNKEVRNSYLPCLPYLSSLQLELVIPDLKTIVPMTTPQQLLLATIAIFHNFHKVGSNTELLFESFQKQNQIDQSTRLKFFLHLKKIIAKFKNH